jgi:Ca-activated chloride channel family protein
MLFLPRPFMKPSVIATYLLTASALAMPRAQNPSADQPSFRTASSELVVLPVTVADKQGRFMADLPADRFSVFDNGRRQDVTLFSGIDTPVTVGLVLDNSGSMRGKLGEVVAAALAFARASNPEDELFALEFNDDVKDALPERRILASDATALERAMMALVPDGRTAMYDALIAGLDRVNQGTRGRRALVLLSDGGDNASTATLDQVLARARKSNVTIYTIGLFTPEDRDTNPGVLKSIAHTTGGERFLPKSAGPLLGDVQRIARELRSGYTLGYEPPDRDGTYHRVRVEVSQLDGPKLVVRTRPGYFAPGGQTQP